MIQTIEFFLEGNIDAGDCFMKFSNELLFTISYIFGPYIGALAMV